MARYKWDGPGDWLGDRRPLPKFNVFVGCDMQGDYCLYVQRDGEYMGDSEMELLAAKVSELLDPGADESVCDCGEALTGENTVSCPDGAEICRNCFNQGRH